ncbi:MAG: heavy-metal-associated domain-containing protein [Candidatus Omnitrophica bacterium]|nr:heavy-metal-associated domain-containing protein [Candidatus Omnitrophota bacterium]
MQKTIGSLILVILLSISVSSQSSAEIEGIQLQVDGLSCPFCAIGINKHLKQQAGLEGIEVHLKQGVTEGKLPPGKGIDIGKVRQAVQEAGFTLRGIKLTIIGRIIQDNGHLAIESRGDGTQFLLFDRGHREVESGIFLEEKLRQRLEQARGAGKIVRVSGAVHEHKGLPSALMIESVEMIPE